MPGEKNEFIDFYHVLQVHHEAQPEVIKSAYRRLAQLYHPDHNREAGSMTQMQNINDAYTVISDPLSRRVYHRQWLQQQSHRQAPSRVRPDLPQDSGQTVLDAYFRNLLLQDWHQAYDLLSSQDQEHIQLADFVEWKKAVHQLYQMGSFAIKSFRTYDKALVGNREYEKVQAFFVFLTDRERRTDRISEETCTKYVVQEAGAWKVCLGYQQLRPIIYKLKYLATQAPHLDAEKLYTETMLKQDRLTGFSSRRGLLEHLKREVSRSQRYGNPLALAVFTVDPKGFLKDVSEEAYARLCLAKVSKKLRGVLRETDCAARIAERQIAVLLIESKLSDGNAALKRLHSKLRADGEDEIRYRLRSSITPYQNLSAEDTLLQAENEAHLQIIASRDPEKKRVRIHIEGQQV